MAKAKGYAEVTVSRPVEPSNEGAGTGISILMVPDTTYRALSDEAAQRNMTVSELVSVAVASYLGHGVKEPEAPLPAVRPVMKGWK